MDSASYQDLLHGLSIHKPCHWSTSATFQSSCLVGRQRHTREVAGSLDFFFLFLSPPSSHPFPASPPSAVGKGTAPGKHALNFHLNFHKAAPGAAQHPLICHSPKSKQDKSSVFFFYLAKGQKSHQDPKPIIPVGDLYWGKGQKWLFDDCVGVVFKVLNISLPSFTALHKSPFEHMHKSRAEPFTQKTGDKSQAIDSNHSREWETHGQPF